MSEERLEKLEKSVQAVRKLVREQDQDQRDLLVGVRWAVLAAAVAGSLLALTAATWRTTTYREDIVEVTTLWGLAHLGALGGLTLALVVVVAVASGCVFVSQVAGPKPHVVLGVLALLAVVPILFVGRVENVTPYWRAVDEPGAGRWLTLVALLVLASLHTMRARDFRG